MLVILVPKHEVILFGELKELYAGAIFNLYCKVDLLAVLDVIVNLIFVVIWQINIKKIKKKNPGSLVAGMLYFFSGYFLCSV